ncbi:hypothetical protein BHE74_00058838 [Ensete ventricosum]|nr:hypothetical protein BHE74_00058838 [Ensete ventricosum]RZS17914.1 hypothetical protein BHM03_00050117 [Ensete ventricosum]
MVANDTLDARFEALEACIEDKLQALFCKFRTSQSESPNKSKGGESPDSKENRFEKCDHGKDIGYPQAEDTDPKFEEDDAWDEVELVTSTVNALAGYANP